MRSVKVLYLVAAVREGHSTNVPAGKNIQFGSKVTRGEQLVEEGRVSGFSE